MISFNYEEFDQEKIQIVQTSWDIANSNEFFGLQLYKKFFAMDESLLNNFKFRNDPDLYISDLFTAHKDAVMNTLNNLIQCLDERDQFNQYL